MKTAATRNDVLPPGRPGDGSGMSYVDGYVLAVPVANKDAYREMAQEVAQILKEYGALSVVECWGDDVPEGETTSFPMAVRLKQGEQVVFSWVLWPSRMVRDEAQKKFMADPRVQCEDNPPPFDGSRMVFGGFEMIVNA